MKKIFLLLFAALASTTMAHGMDPKEKELRRNLQLLFEAYEIVEGKPMEFTTKNDENKNNYDCEQDSQDSGETSSSEKKQPKK